MEKIVAVTFDLANQCCNVYNALEWHNFVCDTRMRLNEDDKDYTLEELLDEYYGDEFWFELVNKPVYDVAFHLPTEEFILCHSDADCEALVGWAEDIGDPEDIFWAEGGKSY